MASNRPIAPHSSTPLELSPDVVETAPLVDEESRLEAPVVAGPGPRRRHRRWWGRRSSGGRARAGGVPSSRPGDSTWGPHAASTVQTTPTLALMLTTAPG